MHRALATGMGMGAILLACSAGGGGTIGGGSISTSVPGTRTLDSLNATERGQWCQDVSAFYNQQVSSTDTRKSSCFSAALRASISQPPEAQRAACAKAYQDCLSAAGATSGSSTSVSANCQKSNVFSACKATVSRVNTCLADEIAAIRSVYQRYDTACDSLGSDAGASSTPRVTEPASCSSIEAQCPGLGSSSTTTTTTNDAPTAAGSATPTGP